MEYKEFILIKHSELVYINKLLRMRGKTIYNKFGLKRDETISHTAHFQNGYEADIKVVICEDEKPYIDAVLFDKNGSELQCLEPAEGHYNGRYEFSYNGNSYTTIVVEGVGKMISRDGNDIGIVKSWNSGPCKMEGCTGHRVHVKWEDGTSTYPCTKGCSSISENTMQIL